MSTYKIENCPYCGNDCEENHTEFDDWFVQCTHCTYQSGSENTEEDAVDLHNTLCQLFVKANERLMELLHQKVNKLIDALDKITELEEEPTDCEYPY